MPELPEVETVVRTLRPQAVGKRIAGLSVGRMRLRRPWRKSWTPRVVGQTIIAIDRRGKWIIVSLDTGRLLVHLGMTGQFRIHPSAAPLEPHTHIVFDLGATQLRYRDERRFGSVDYFADGGAIAKFLDARLGPEPFDLEPGPWRVSLAESRRSIKAVLLDQSVVAGVGNIYADEALFVAKIAPATPANAIRPAAAERLRRAVVEVLTFAIDCRGSSIRNYLDGTGEPGGYQNEFRVYGRTGEPCMTCGTAVTRVRLAGRSTHSCPRCQPVR
ncbi:MAG: bifunctional DNA-formamidopyrimidine glycosylase/DNA-(apurinic or apyrimidinic site) lyase [Gemmataceae bacterium]|nr:bifunctional DNA-formamidopyrimidine glycosylase/DNA-(apurinic or apyrimidinic site) lyase [Gemmataceae bacterium]